MQKKENPSLKNVARLLRKRMTRQERHLWYDYLKDYPCRFYRQRILGDHIADFYCSRAGLVVELDGSSHYKPENVIRDGIRTERLGEFGLTVLRISNYDVDTNFEGVCLYIDRTVKSLIAVNNLGGE